MVYWGDTRLGSPRGGRDGHAAGLTGLKLGPATRQRRTWEYTLTAFPETDSDETSLSSKVRAITL